MLKFLCFLLILESAVWLPVLTTRAHYLSAKTGTHCSWEHKKGTSHTVVGVCTGELLRVLGMPVTQLGGSTDEASPESCDWAI